jgi:hypothetical protein
MVVPLGVARSNMPLARRVPLGLKMEGSEDLAIAGEYCPGKEPGINLAKAPNPLPHGNLFKPGGLCP